MTTFFKKTLCIIFVLITLSFTLISCGDNGGTVNTLTGELTAESFRNFYGYVWTGAGLKEDNREDLIPNDEQDYNVFLDALASGRRIKNFFIPVRDLSDLEGKKFTKISFTLEADRDVTLTIAVDTVKPRNYKKTVTLTANQPQNIEIVITNPVEIAGECVCVDFYRIADIPNPYATGAHYFYNSPELGEWSQTIYKVTDLKIFCE